MLAARYEAFTPVKIRELVAAYFRKGAPTVDIGSGSGRDTAYLTAQGYPTEGVEASDGMRAEALRLHPGFTYHKDSLPDLATLKDDSFHNLLSNAVLMHLSDSELEKGLLNILRVLAPQGRAVISFRGPSVPSHDNDRQISLFTLNQVTKLLESLGGKVLLAEPQTHEGVIWNYLVAEKTG
jgi:SAM-dependent methyltransferase